MSGHNKWSQIKRQKGAADAAKSSLWGKLSRRITVESKKANGDTNAVALRSVIEKARQTNMPKDSIERAVVKGTGTDAGEMESITYETYGPGGCAIIIETLTDSRNRTAQEIKHLLSKNGLALAAPGSAAWAFTHLPDGTWEPQTTVPLSESDTESLMRILEEVDAHDDVEEVYTNAE
jgi:YebC/PmpR family DNA-binding regulatory protein